MHGFRAENVLSGSSPFVGADSSPAGDVLRGRLMLQILVDYDNLSRAIRGLGLQYVIDRILARVTVDDAERDVSLKIYGGWYSLAGLTSVGTLMAADIHANYPRIQQVATISGGTRPARISVNLACALEADPGTHLFHTYRERGTPANLKCRTPPAVGCQQQTCPGQALHHFVQIGSCPDAACAIPVKRFLYRGEQKMVDTMIVADLIHMCMSGAPRLFLVSSDDDFWPGIKTALLLGTAITRIETQLRNFAPRYLASAGANFSAIHI